MIVPRKIVCDTCGREFGRMVTRYKINCKTIFEGSGGRITEKGHIDLCKDCMIQFRIWLKEQLEEQKE